MTTKQLDRTGGSTMMQRTRTWILLYALGIALLVLSLCQSDKEKPAEKPQLPATVHQGAAIAQPETPATLMRQ